MIPLHVLPFHDGGDASDDLLHGNAQVSASYQLYARDHVRARVNVHDHDCHGHDRARDHGHVHNLHPHAPALLRCT